MKMLTPLEESLLEIMQTLKVDWETIVGIMLMIPKDDQIADMAEFLSGNPNATEEEIVEVALKISAERESDTVI